ncbi:hypothetical protein OUZ56_020495 [Daphnia magna]|uniref:Uncharacterized protein n=1 Tax=Daphnia magna TaxID=35525 RepID=A0ABQ9ZEM7_9CRUS|nr:hypothetical protein OUZ56_020495 [Daphnia magna]
MLFQGNQLRRQQQTNASIYMAHLSAQCHQSIKYECNYSPFLLNGVSYAWWNDKHENRRYFWAGSGNRAHICQCGIDGYCIDPAAKCNCDAVAPILLSDEGIVTNKHFLPITKLNFGRTQLPISSGVHTLGPFECSGQVAVNRMPSSCEDLWKIGHTLSGLHSVAAVQQAAKRLKAFTAIFLNSRTNQVSINGSDL